MQRFLTQFKKDYVDNFAVQMKIPAQYVLDCKIFPANSLYYVLLIKNVLPQDSDDVQFVVHSFGDTYEKYPEALDSSEYYDNEFFDHLNLKLIKFENGYLKQVKDLPIEAQSNAIMEFSMNGKYLALYQSDNYILKFFEI